MRINHTATYHRTRTPRRWYLAIRDQLLVALRTEMPQLNKLECHLPSSFGSKHATEAVFSPNLRSLSVDIWVQLQLTSQYASAFEQAQAYTRQMEEDLLECVKQFSRIPSLETLVMHLKSKAPVMHLCQPRRFAPLVECRSLSSLTIRGNLVDYFEGRQEIRAVIIETCRSISTLTHINLFDGEWSVNSLQALTAGSTPLLLKRINLKETLLDETNAPFLSRLSSLTELAP